MEVTNAVANYLYENPLGAHQHITTLEQNRYRVSVIVDDTNQLRTTLRSFGRGVDIISPEKMKFQIHQ